MIKTECKNRNCCLATLRVVGKLGESKVSRKGEGCQKLVRETGNSEGQVLINLFWVREI